MKQVVLITGANGMLAKYLSELLESNYSVRFLTRKVREKNEYLWDLNTEYIDPKAFKNVNHIIHLAGASIADSRWTKKRKQAIYSSRIDSAQLILDELKKHKITLESFISASAVGYYGPTTTNIIFNEESSNGNDFLSEVCYNWEQVAHSFKSDKVATKVAIVRIGIIVAKNEGAIQKIAQPIKWGFGAGIGSGKQWMPWIHIHDLSSIFKWLLDNKNISGTFNAVAPQHISNLELTREIADVLRRKIILPNIPVFVMKSLFGEMAVILLKGSRVSSEKIIKSGFSFKYNNIKLALVDVLDAHSKV